MDQRRTGQTAEVEGLTEPLPRRLRAQLRQAVVDLAGDRRRVHPPTLHVGAPGGGAASIALDDATVGDPGLRTDVVAALRVRIGDRPDALVWLTRSGGLDVQDVDMEWLAAARAAHQEAGAPLVYVVVTRRGWRDPRSGVGRTWTRVRPAASST